MATKERYQLLDRWKLGPLPTHKLYYLCTTYTVHPGGLDRAYEDACEIAGKLLAHGIKTFCPIAHGHPLSRFVPADKGDHDYWLSVDKFYLDRCDEVIVACTKHWPESKGIDEEVRYAARSGKHVHYLDPICGDLYADREDAWMYYEGDIRDGNFDDGD